MGSITLVVRLRCRCHRGGGVLRAGVGAAGSVARSPRFRFTSGAAGASIAVALGAGRRWLNIHEPLARRRTIAAEDEIALEAR